MTRGDASLTATEERIAEFVCRGLSNPEIAAELFVEPTTIRWHLKNVFRKLGVRNRAELAARLVRNSPDRDPSGSRNGPTVGQAEAPSDRTSSTEG